MPAAVRGIRAAGVLLVLCLAVTACTDEPVVEPTPTPAPAARPPAPAQTTPEPVDEPTPTAGPDVDDDDDADELPPDVPRRGDTIAVLDGPIEGVTAEITKLRRTGPQVVELEVVFVNETSADVRRLHGFALDGGVRPLSDDYGTAAGIALVDAVNGRRHFTLRDGDGRCACSPDVELLPRGARLPVYVSFPAPPEDVTEMTVQIPGFGTIEVPLS
jgi:hypothetical protein